MRRIPRVTRGPVPPTLVLALSAEYLPSILARALFRRGVARNPPPPQKAKLRLLLFPYRDAIVYHTADEIGDARAGFLLFCGFAGDYCPRPPWVNSLAFYTP